MKYRYEFIVRDDEGTVVFASDKPSIELLEEDIGRFERHIKDGQRAVEPGVFLG